MSRAQSSLWAATLIFSGILLLSDFASAACPQGMIANPNGGGAFACVTANPSKCPDGLAPVMGASGWGCPAAWQRQQQAQQQQVQHTAPQPVVNQPARCPDGSAPVMGPAGLGCPAAWQRQQQAQQQQVQQAAPAPQPVVNQPARCPDGQPPVMGPAGLGCPAAWQRQQQAQQQQVQHAAPQPVATQPTRCPDGSAPVMGPAGPGCLATWQRQQQAQQQQVQQAAPQQVVNQPARCPDGSAPVMGPAGPGCLATWQRQQQAQTPGQNPNASQDQVFFGQKQPGAVGVLQQVNQGGSQVVNGGLQKENQVLNSAATSIRNGTVMQDTAHAIKEAVVPTAYAPTVNDPVPGSQPPPPANNNQMSSFGTVGQEQKAGGMVNLLGAIGQQGGKAANAGVSSAQPVVNGMQNGENNWNKSAAGQKVNTFIKDLFTLKQGDVPQ